IAELGNRDREVRVQLVTLLARMAPDPHAATSALIAVLREPMESDQAGVSGPGQPISYSGPAQGAARALGRIAPGTPAAGVAITALTEVVQAGPAQRRAAAAEALGQFGPAAVQAVTALITMLKETAAAKVPTGDGASAARALGRIAKGTPS